jgi:hypothetical protein
MGRRRITLIIDEEVLRAVRVKAARTEKRNFEVIEESLCRDLGLDDPWAKLKPAHEENA